MSFINERITECVGLNFTGGPEWNTLIRQLASGAATYRANWAMPHHRYTADFTMLEPEESNALLEAFWVARGRFNSFRFKDWNDYIATNQAMVNGDGTSNPRQLTKAYSFGGQTITRNIILPIASTVVVTANGAPITVTTNEQTGMVTPSAPWPTGQAIRAWFEFDVKVKFNSDYFAQSREGHPVGRTTIEIVEAILEN